MSSLAGLPRSHFESAATETPAFAAMDSCVSPAASPGGMSVAAKSHSFVGWGGGFDGPPSGGAIMGAGTAGVAGGEYIARNPERAGLIEQDGFREYAFTGCLVPGYPELKLWEPDSWTRFWRCYSYLRKNGLIHGESEDNSSDD